MRIFFVLILLFIFSNCSDSKVSNYDEIEKVFEHERIIGVTIVAIGTSIPRKFDMVILLSWGIYSMITHYVTG